MSLGKPMCMFYERAEGTYPREGKPRASPSDKIHILWNTAITVNQGIYNNNGKLEMKENFSFNSDGYHGFVGKGCSQASA